MAFEIRIRPMETGDIEEMETMEHGSFPEPYNAAIWRQEWQNTISRTFVALPGKDGGGNHLTGYINFWIVIDEAQLHRLAVKEDCRRRGIAAGLIRHMLRYLSECSVSTVQLEVRQSNMPALRLYDKFGFVTWGRRRGYYRETGEDALLLTGAVKDILNVAYTESGG